MIETNFYRLENPGNSSPVYWEAWLSIVEEKASAVFLKIDKLGYTGSISDEQQQWLCLFLAVQLTRTKGARVRRRALVAEQVRQLLNVGAMDDVISFLRWDDRRHLGIKRMDIEAEVNRFQEDPMLVPMSREEDLSLSATTARHIAGILATRHMVLYRTDRRIITCDEPVVEFCEDFGNRPLSRAAWGSPIIVFPFGPYQVLALYRRDIEPPLSSNATLNIYEVADLNKVILGSGNRFAIASPDDHIASKLYFPPAPQSVRSIRISLKGAGEDEALIQFWSPSRWDGDPLAPRRPVERWWPDSVSEAPAPTIEEQKIMEQWSLE